MKKYKVFAVSVLCILTIIGGTYAYFVTEGTARNVITASNVVIRLNIQDENGSDARGDALDIMPGKSIERTVSVTNTGSEPAWIRVKAAIGMGDNSFQISENGAATDNPDLAAGGINQSDWIYTDGYFYYTKVLEPSETTPPLFTRIEFKGSMGNEYAKQSITLDAEAYGTQSRHNGDTVTEAKGWPEEE